MQFVVHLEISNKNKHSANEWILCKYAFDNYLAADNYAKQLDVIAYVIEELEEY